MDGCIMAFPVATHVIFDGGPIVNKRGAAKVYKQELHSRVRLWHQDDLKNHFEEFSAGKYGYTPRSSSYVKRKRARRGHNRGIVKTGRTKALAMRHIRVTGTKTRARGAMVVPWYIRMTRTKTRGPRLGHELTRVIDSEMRRHADGAAKSAGQEFDKMKGRVTVDLGA